jgi:hypothetical protein
MTDPARFPFLPADVATGGASLMPLLPLTLMYGERSVQVSGLLDTGAAVNVLPYPVGVELGAVWEEQGRSLKLTGNLARFEARVLIVTASVAEFAPVDLAFAWTRAENAPLLLGQMNFFMEFDVCFFRTRRLFEVQPKREA